MIFDTSIILEILRNKKFLEKLKIDEEVRITSITVYELLRGAILKKLKSYSTRELNVILDLLEELEIEGFSPTDARIASLIWAKLRKTGRNVNDADIMIASICISRNEALVTKDVDFEKIKKVEPKLKLKIIK